MYFVENILSISIDINVMYFPQTYHVIILLKIYLTNKCIENWIYL